MSTSVKSSEKQLPSQEIFRAILLFNWSNVRLKRLKGLRAIKIIKEIKFEWVWGEFELKIVCRDNNSQNI